MGVEVCSGNSYAKRAFFSPQKVFGTNRGRTGAAMYGQAKDSMKLKSEVDNEGKMERGMTTGEAVQRLRRDVSIIIDFSQVL